MATVLPFVPVTYGWIMLLADSARDAAVIAASLNSLVVDYCLRNKLSQASIPQGTVYQLPILPPTFYIESRLTFVTPKVLELTYTSYSLTPFARELGHDGPPFAWDEDRRAQLRADLDAFYARAYGLDRDDLRYILDPSLPDAPLKEFELRVANLPRTTEAERLAVQRIGQDIFRHRLMDYWQSRCPLTGISDTALLRASHIIPWVECESDAERLNVHNGLLLSALWDAAFDRALVTFDDQGRPELSHSLSEQARAELRWSSPISLTDEHRRRLARHRERTRSLS